jgi:hypothetical protein
VPKCDEQGPPCANCVVRDITGTCTYKASPQAHVPVTVPEAGAESGSPSGSETHSSPPPLSDSIAALRILELELMHRWSTTTYKSICSVPEDHYYLQIEVPRGALKHDFLLHGVFAISALEIAVCGDLTGDLTESAKYMCTAMEYYDKASESFRAALCDVTPENQHYLYIFAIAATIINIAMPENVISHGANQSSSMLQRMVVLFDLCIGACFIATMSWEWMMESPFSPSLLSALSLLEKAPPNPISDDTTKAFEHLMIIIDQIEESKDSVCSRESYKNSISKLHYCFLEDSKGWIRGFCLAYPILAGQDFTNALRTSEPMALYILMYWGVLLDRLGSEAWWSANVGSNLVLEISDVLLALPSKVSMLPEWKAGISWARQEVRLAPL